MKRKNPFPGVTRSTDRHGKVRFRFRRGAVDTYLPGAYASAEFRIGYEAAVKGSKTPAIRSNAAYGSLAWLIETYLRSPRYLDLSDGRRASLRGLLDFLRAEAGDLPFGRFASRHVEALMAKKAGPVAANNVKKTLSLLFNFAIKHELADQKINPARHADRRKESADGFHTWTDAEIAKFLDHHGPGTKARRALMIFLCTGAARQDAAAMGKGNVKEGRISYRRGKTGVEADLPILPDLAAELAHVPPFRSAVSDPHAGPRLQARNPRQLVQGSMRGGGPRPLHGARAAQSGRDPACRCRRFRVGSHGFPRSRDTERGRDLHQEGRAGEAGRFWLCQDRRIETGTQRVQPSQKVGQIGDLTCCKQTTLRKGW